MGINTSNFHVPVIVNNIIYKNSHHGIVASYYSAPTIINNTIAFNGEHGIASQSGIGIVMNNIISFNGGNGIFCSLPESSPEISYNNVFGNQLGNFFSCLPGEGDISADPLFIDAVNNDYHLHNESPCIGAGIMTPEVPDTDIERTPRPNPPDSYPDMGACEYPSFSPPLNFIGQKVLNRSLSQIEYINKLNWQSNPDNADLNILNYRIYQLDEMGISLLVELDANTFEYWHRDIDKYEECNYAICAVNDDGSESIRSFATVQ
jgi:parallel beta-helix repeat protein